MLPLHYRRSCCNGDVSSLQTKHAFYSRLVYDHFHWLRDPTSTPVLAMQAPRGKKQLSLSKALPRMGAEKTGAMK